MRYPNNLKAIRNRPRTGGKLTLAKLAETLGIAEGTLSRYESGSINIPSSRLLALAEAYGTTPSEIFEGHVRVDDEPRYPLPSAEMLATLLKVVLSSERASRATPDELLVFGTVLRNILADVATGAVQVHETDKIEYGLQKGIESAFRGTRSQV